MLMSFWSKLGSDSVRVAELERRVQALEDRFSKVTKEVLEATETLDRVTKRAFRLNEQTRRLEEQQNAEKPVEATPEGQRAAILRNFGHGRI